MGPPEAREALLPHLMTTLAIDWDRPPPDVWSLLDRVDALPWVETGDHERYLVTVDAPAHGDSARDERYRRALAAVRAHADAGAVLDLALVSRVQTIVLGGPGPIRTTTAFARGGSEAYAHFDGLGAMFGRKIAADARDGCHPLVQACRLYLDIIFFHPFADGNARAARLWFEFLLRRARVPVPPIEDVVRLEKSAGDESAAWRLVRLAAKRLLERTLCAAPSRR
jgi:hypothetical protein